MSVQESQVPLPDPPTGVALIIAEHEYNPENGHYEPPIRGVPLNASADCGITPATNPLIAVALGAPVWIYHLVFANTGGAIETVVLTEPGPLANTYTVQVPANTTMAMISTPSAPLFVSRVAAAGNITAQSTAGTTTVTVTYVVK